MMMFKKKESLAGLVLAAVLGAGSSAALGVTWGDETGNHLKIGGYVRGWASFNLADVPETTQDDKWDASMIRGSVSLTGNAQTGPISWGAVVRADQEDTTSFQARLERLTRIGGRYGTTARNPDGTVNNPAFFRSVIFPRLAGPASPLPDGKGGDVTEEYNQVRLREFYAEADLTDRLKLRFGKQQVVWGESDFFRGMDLVHGYDMRWRSFVEPENEELRKPLIMANFMLQVPEANGMLQAIVRPGWDDHDDIGNDYDLFGGRWMPNPLRGSDFLSRRGTMTYDRRHKDGDADDATYGLRWRQIAGPVTYSVAYLKTFNPDPIASFNWALPANTAGVDMALDLLNGGTGAGTVVPVGTAAALGMTTLGGVLNGVGTALFGNPAFACGTAHNPSAVCPTTMYKGDPSNGVLGEWIFPKIELLGFTATGYAPALDTVLSTEIVYTRNAPFVTGTKFLQNVDAATFSALINVPAGLQGFRGIKKKEQLSMMFRFDKTLKGLNDLLGTSEVPFFTVQVFDKWILGYDKKDDIVEIPGFNAPKREHSTIVTAVLVTQFKNSTINPSLAGGFDPREGGGFLIPAVELVFGDNWRLRMEADLFFPRGESKQSGSPGGTATGGPSPRAHIFGVLANQDQFLFRLTRQF